MSREFASTAFAYTASGPVLLSCYDLRPLVLAVYQQLQAFKSFLLYFPDGWSLAPRLSFNVV